ncbi:MAG TPA: NifB/NifX family molybdenum-iron cluster-binding protein [Bacteroidaceae bacterium]|nr:NifB/NifX family molybdenum-iron cluster-binding protein [Bacteroidaceae bacterium]
MKIAIASEKNSLESNIDSRFGRCPFFAFYDSKTDSLEFLPNPAKEVAEGAGPMAVQFIASKGVKKIVAGEFGIKIKSLLDTLNIEMLIKTNQKVSDIVKQFKI